MMWMVVWMSLFWLAVAAGVVWLFTNTRGSSGDDAIEALRHRLARGDIDAEEFRRREEILQRTDGVGRRRSGLLALGVAAVIALFVIIPVAAMAAGNWDMGGMWNMHGGGRNTSDSPVVQGSAQASVRIEDFAFQPGNLQVPVGATVTWTNADSAPHDATARGAGWKTGRLSDGDSDTLTFDRAGDYDYYCSIHPSMKAKLVVR